MLDGVDFTYSECLVGYYSAELFFYFFHCGLGYHNLVLKVLFDSYDANL